jgi:hypothetical protein
LVKAVACELVAETQQPLSRQSLADLTTRAHQALGQPISRSTVWRILTTDAIQPWRYQYWIFPRDPQFAEKAGPILDLYEGVWQGQSLHRLFQVDSRLIRVHTPVHASWLNQGELYFSIIQRKVLPPNDVADVQALRLRLALYEALSNQQPTPFQWKFNRAKLAQLLAKIEAHEKFLIDGQLHCAQRGA